MFWFSWCLRVLAVFLLVMIDPLLNLDRPKLHDHIRKLSRRRVEPLFPFFNRSLRRVSDDTRVADA